MPWIMPSVRRGARRWVALGLLAPLAGCPSIPDGRLRCGPGIECPPGLLCAADDTCRREELDTGDQAELDAGHDASMPRDVEMDAPPLADVRPDAELPRDAAPDAPLGLDAASADAGTDASMIPDAPSCGDAALPATCTTVCGGTGTEYTCRMGEWECTPPPERCNLLDDDCDGLTDESFVMRRPSGVALADLNRDGFSCLTGGVFSRLQCMTAARRYCARAESECGDGFCHPFGEDETRCPADCPQPLTSCGAPPYICGEPGEDELTCAFDCGCNAGSSGLVVRRGLAADATLACASAAALGDFIVTWSELGYAGPPSVTELDSRDAQARANAYCTTAPRAGFVAGIGPVEAGPTLTLVFCVRSGYGAVESTSWTSLEGRLGCGPTTHNELVCDSAADDFCRSRGDATGLIVGDDGTDIEILCLRELS